LFLPKIVTGVCARCLNELLWIMHCFMTSFHPILISLCCYRDLSFNNITGQVPQALLNLNLLSYLFLGNNSLSGSLPSSIGPSLKNLDFSYNQLSGSFPSWVGQNLQLNLVANNFVINNSHNSALPSGLGCLQRDTPCFLGSPQCELLPFATSRSTHLLH